MQDEKIDFKASNAPAHTVNWLESVEKLSSSSGLCPRILNIADSPDKFDDRIIFMSMFNDIGWTKKFYRMFFECRQGQELRDKVSAWT